MMDTQEKLTILKKLVEINSVNDNERQVADYLKSLFDKADIKNKIIPLKPRRADLVAQLGTGKPVLAVSGHMDVVAVDKTKWNSDPFRLTQDGDRLLGRGTSDMKGGLAALVIALLEIKEKKFPFSGTLRFLATAGEEFGQQGACVLQKQGWMKDVDTLLIGEPTGYRAVYANKGEIDLTLKAYGKTAHSSMPTLGQNAIVNLIGALNQIRADLKPTLQNHPSPLLGPTYFNLDTITGGRQINALPAYAESQINIRTVPQLKNKTIIDHLRQIIQTYNTHHSGEIKSQITMDIVPVAGKKDSPFVHLIAKIAQPYLKKQLTLPGEKKRLANFYKKTGIVSPIKNVPQTGLPYGTDASKLLIDRPIGANYVVFGPGDDNAHQDNEYVSKTMFLNFCHIYLKLFLAYLKN